MPMLVFCGVPVILSPEGRISQHFVGGDDSLQRFVGGRRPRWSGVGMVGTQLPAVGVSDLRLARRRRHAEHEVRIEIDAGHTKPHTVGGVSGVLSGEGR